MLIGDRIKELRTSKRLSQSELAERIGVTRATISAYELGSRLPSYDVLIKIAQQFHVSTDNLLGLSSKHSIDVTDLNQKQRNTLHEVVSTYKRHNFMHKNAIGTAGVENALKDMGLAVKFDDPLEDG